MHKRTACSHTRMHTLHDIVNINAVLVSRVSTSISVFPSSTSSSVILSPPSSLPPPSLFLLPLTHPPRHNPFSIFSYVTPFFQSSSSLPLCASLFTRLSFSWAPNSPLQSQEAKAGIAAQLYHLPLGVKVLCLPGSSGADRRKNHRD